MKKNLKLPMIIKYRPNLLMRNLLNQKKKKKKRKLNLIVRNKMNFSKARMGIKQTSSSNSNNRFKMRKNLKVKKVRKKEVRNQLLLLLKK
jgi:hypothetical protein